MTTQQPRARGISTALGNIDPKSPSSIVESPLGRIENEINLIPDEDFSYKPINCILGEEDKEQWSFHYLLKDGAVERNSNPLSKSR